MADKDWRFLFWLSYCAIMGFGLAAVADGQYAKAASWVLGATVVLMGTMMCLDWAMEMSE